MTTALESGKKYAIHDEDGELEQHGWFIGIDKKGRAVFETEETRGLDYFDFQHHTFVYVREPVLMKGEAWCFLAATGAAFPEDNIHLWKDKPDSTLVSKIRYTIEEILE